MDLSATGCVNEGSQAVRGGDVHTTLPEYHHPVYRHLAYTGAMYSGGSMARGAGVDEMVVADRT